MIHLKWINEQRTVNSLLVNKKSPRKISKDQLERLKASLEKFNLVEIPAIDFDGTILAGHQRIKALQILGRGDELIDVRIPNRKLTQQEFDRYTIGSNAIQGEWDMDLLKEFDIELLSDFGFNPEDLQQIWQNQVIQEEFDLEKELKNIKKPLTQPGDIIQLGSHKIICGDSTKKETLQKLFAFQDKKASMIMSDPIYNISIDYNAGIGGKQSYGGTVNDSKPDDEYKKFLKSSMLSALSVTKKDAHIFYWSDETYIWLIQTLYREIGITNKRVCLWLKNGHNPTPGVAFNKAYEPCTYGVLGKPYLNKNLNQYNEVMNEEMSSGNALVDEVAESFTVWPVKRLSSHEYEHSTMKPPEVYEKAIKRCTKPGDIILDSFLGSGSTLVAAEKLKRIVYGVEIEPVFCDLAIRRYELLTNRKVIITREGNEKNTKEIIIPRAY